MGASTIEIFDDDDAADWAADLVETDDLSLIVESLTEMVEVEKGEYIERDVCARALAAATVLAGLLHGPSDNLPEEVQAWITAYAHLDGRAYKKLATRAVKRCRNDKNAELRELWEEGSPFYYPAWLAQQNTLLTKLAQ